VKLISLPRFKLAHLPTPLEPAPNLTRVLGGPDIWFKRDDMTGLALGGNKSRKLEFLVADASRRTTTLNAYVSGYGATHRIVVYDTLLDQAPDEEIQIVVRDTRRAWDGTPVSRIESAEGIRSSAERLLVSVGINLGALRMQLSRAPRERPDPARLYRDIVKKFTPLPPKCCARCTTFFEREFRYFRGRVADLFGTGSSGLGWSSACSDITQPREWVVEPELHAGC
jgi:hypothetical protein